MFTSYTNRHASHYHEPMYIHSHKVIAVKELPVKWLLENLSATEGNRQVLEQQYSNSRKDKFNALTKVAQDHNLVQSMNNMLNNPTTTTTTANTNNNTNNTTEVNHHTTIAAAVEGEDEFLPRLNLPPVGYPIAPLEFKSEKYEGTLLIGLSSLPSVPVISKDSMSGAISSKYEVANLGNFSCAILP
jgi:hypothetical protein